MNLSQGLKSAKWSTYRVRFVDRALLAMGPCFQVISGDAGHFGVGKGLG